MDYEFLTQRDIQWMGNHTALNRIAPRCNKLVEDCYHKVPEFQNFAPQIDFSFKADVLDQLILEAIKMDYDTEMESHSQSLRQYILQEGDYENYEQGKQIWIRKLKYVQYYRDMQADRLKNEYGSFPHELFGDDVSGIENRLIGHRITPVQFEEMKNMRDVPIFGKIVYRQIVDVKKVSNEDFKYYYRQYDILLNDYRKAMVFDDDIDDSTKARSIIKNTMAFFTLEWKFSLEWIYRIASDIEKGVLPESSLYQATRFCVPLNYLSFYGENRFFMARERYYEMMCHPIDHDIKAMTLQYCFMHFLMQFLKENLRQELQDIMQKLTLTEKAAFLQERYWIWDIFQKKKWENKTIRYARKAFDILFLDYKHPNLR